MTTFKKSELIYLFYIFIYNLIVHCTKFSISNSWSIVKLKLINKIQNPNALTTAPE